MRFAKRSIQVQGFCDLMERYIDRFICCKYSTILSNRWLAVRLEFVGNCVVLCAAMLVILSQRWHFAMSAGIAGFSISYALNVKHFFLSTIGTFKSWHLFLFCRNPRIFRNLKIITLKIHRTFDEIQNAEEFYFW